MAGLTLEFLQNILAEDYPDVVIQEFHGAPGTKRGDNYTSMVYRVTLKGVRKIVEPDGSIEHEEPWEGSIIYKCLPESILRREVFKSDELFCNEVAFYTKIWPAFSNFQAQWEKVKSPFKAIPKCYLAQNDLVILKDLKRMGYVMADRRQGLTIEQSYFVMKQLSQFHALSLAMKCENPEAFYELLNARDGIFEGSNRDPQLNVSSEAQDYLTRQSGDQPTMSICIVCFVAENQEHYRSYYTEAIRNAIAMVEEELANSEDKDRYLKKFKEFCDEETFFQLMVDLVAPKEPLSVITHGDCWTNNLLFKYVNGDIAEMYLVDFQMVRYGSPALDLAYVLYLCLDREQRTEHLGSLLEYYLDELHKRLLEMTDEDSIFNLSLNRNTLNELLLEQFKQSGRYALGIALDMYPIMTCDSNEAPNVYQEKESDSKLPQDDAKPVFTVNAECKRKMTDLVVELVDAGVL